MTSVLYSLVLPHKFCRSPLLMGLAATNTITAGLGSSPSWFDINEIASRHDCTRCPALAMFTELLPCQAPHSVPSGRKAFEVPFTILPPWMLLCLLAGSWTPAQTEPITQAPAHLAHKYLHAAIAKWHLTWEPDLP